MYRLNDGHEVWASHETDNPGFALQEAADYVESQYEHGYGPISVTLVPTWIGDTDGFTYQAIVVIDRSTEVVKNA